ncbi:cysteine hydrolase family protein [Scopulibacillus cellulosilyticus]|uniref:Cysteine hydrolase family protein n=1 Tax=Scopulibacillus cellulosilyticus TaxID=2665665 RepID=A0ABW2PT51_9BACL
MIVDVQNAMFLHDDAALFNGEKVLDNIRNLIKKARDSKMPVIYIQHTEQADDQFAEGSFTWRIHSAITPLKDDIIVQKTTCDSFHKTNLQEELALRNIDSLVIAGMQTEFCIDTTCRRAFSMGYHNILVEDAHSTFDSRVLSGSQIVEHHNNILGGGFVQLKKTDEIVF